MIHPLRWLWCMFMRASNKFQHLGSTLLWSRLCSNSLRLIVQLCSWEGVGRQERWVTNCCGHSCGWRSFFKSWVRSWTCSTNSCWCPIHAQSQCDQGGWREKTRSPIACKPESHGQSPNPLQIFGQSFLGLGIAFLFHHHQVVQLHDGLSLPWSPFPPGHATWHWSLWSPCRRAMKNRVRTFCSGHFFRVPNKKRWRRSCFNWIDGFEGYHKLCWQFGDNQPESSRL